MAKTIYEHDRRICHSEARSGRQVPVILRREAPKNLLENTGMLAEVALADILESFMRFFTSLRFVQNDNSLANCISFRMT